MRADTFAGVFPVVSFGTPFFAAAALDADFLAPAADLRDAPPPTAGFPVAAPAAAVRVGLSVTVSVAASTGAARVLLFPPTPSAPPPRAGPGLPDADCWSAVFFATMAGPLHIL
ncbi:hypothetical protein N4P33_18255 [Streptomyces sp. 15-116A]|uniref:hypothetical protein n=1 Tax=Streptomyces sp. 15-116A TaxID=2259035 RepID=UPI0021B3D051|nr:hypothetical protein [Streptomyces sp. 15-116A]MCT7354085.1 hypothetical protein [Streptomyces sp. 15-116A]